MAVATAAITFARSPNASKSTRKSCASQGRKACFCARSSPLKAQKRQVLACPVLYRSGAPEEIRTPDPQIRSLVLYPAELRARFSLRHLGLRPGCFRYKARKPREERLSYPLRPQLASGGNARRVA